MKDIKVFVDAVKHLNEVWNECSKNIEEEDSSNVYNAMCDVDEALIHLVEKVSTCVKEQSIAMMYGTSDLAKTHKTIIDRS